MSNPFKTFERQIFEEKNQIRELKALLIRAAEALEAMDPKWEGDQSQLIAELRKAAG